MTGTEPLAAAGLNFDFASGQLKGAALIALLCLGIFAVWLIAKGKSKHLGMMVVGALAVGVVMAIMTSVLVGGQDGSVVSFFTSIFTN